MVCDANEVYLISKGKSKEQEEIRLKDRINLLITTDELMVALSCGRRRAISIGEMAGARVEIGRCVRWNVEILKEFLRKEAF